MSKAVRSLLYSQLFADLPVPSADLSGQTIVVTGSNTGLGLEAARHFARLKPKKLILAVRSQAKGKNAQAEIEQSTGCPHGIIEIWDLDMASYASVKSFAQRLDSLDRLDALVENAGISKTKFELVEDNEATLTVNVVSTFLLALLALPKLQKTATTYSTIPRLSIVNSGALFRMDFPEKDHDRIFDSLNDEANARMRGRYVISKVVGLLLIRQLAQRMTESSKPSVILNAVAPGLCKSTLMSREASFAFSIVVTIINHTLARTTEKGGRCLVAGGLAGKETHGQWMMDCTPAEPPPFFQSEDGKNVGRKLWTELSEKLEKIQPGILGNI